MNQRKCHQILDLNLLQTKGWHKLRKNELNPNIGHFPQGWSSTICRQQRFLVALAGRFLKTKQTKVTPLRGGNLSNGHRGSIQNSPVYELRHVICKNGSSLSQSTHWVTRSEQGHFDKFCFHDDELTSEKGEVSKDLYSVEYSQMLACFHFQPFSSHGSVPSLFNLPGAVFLHRLQE